mgnify:CR=1 FL=1
MLVPIVRGSIRSWVIPRVMKPRRTLVVVGYKVFSWILPFDVKKELEEDLRPERYVGRAPQQVDEFLAEWVAPVLERYAHDVEHSAPELHV